ncbi:MAG: peptidase MA family metallohydrolase [Candidatus Omnitrophica bacterium]|nr:peptidase MA family metallohydrolase [Candidatus Omnitrophota bacterium]
MRKAIFIALFLVLSICFVLAQDNWHIAKSTHFIIHYKNAKGDFIEDLIERAEDYYYRIAEALGFRRYNFWLWDNRAKIYIYNDLKEYQMATGQPSWSQGATLPKDKIIYTFVGQKGFFETILVHEMGHIIFREFVGFDNPAVPLWLDEGVASYQEKMRVKLAKEIIHKAYKENKFYSLQKLNQVNLLNIFNPEFANLFYAEAVSIVNYLIKEFGVDNFVLFCQALRDKRDLERAISYAYPFRDIQGLDKAWQRYLLKE